MLKRLLSVFRRKPSVHVHVTRSFELVGEEAEPANRDLPCAVSEADLIPQPAKRARKPAAKKSAKKSTRKATRKQSPRKVTKRKTSRKK